MINWQFFPKSTEAPNHLLKVIEIFKKHSGNIDSNNFENKSNEVLAILCTDLQDIDYKVEVSKKQEGKIKVPVLFGRNGTLEKYFYADGYNKNTKTVIEVEAGRAVTNNQFLKDLFQASVMHDIDYLIIAVRNVYSVRKDFEIVATFFDTLYASDRLKLPLKGVLIIGY